MKSNIFLRVIIGTFVLLFAMCCQAAPVAKVDAINFANTIGKQLLSDFQEKDLVKRYHNLDNLLLKHVDIEYIGKFVIGKYWRIMSSEQQKKYNDIFRRYCLSYYKTLPLDFASTLAYEVASANVDGKFTNVTAIVRFNMNDTPQEMALVFRLHEADGVIKLVDVKIAESSMLLAYRSKFYNMVVQNDEEIDWFLEDLEDTTTAWENSLNENSSNKQNSLEIKQEKL